MGLRETLKVNMDRALLLRRALPIAIKQFGGLTGLISKCILAYRTHGWLGIKRGIVSVLSSGKHGNDYQSWLKSYDLVSMEESKDFMEISHKWQNKPLISVLLPTYNTPINWLIEAIESVRNQVYDNWELCIADDGSENPEIKKVLAGFCAQDARIKVTYRTENGHISKSSNSALALCTGEWVALLDHDDLLHKTAFFWVVDAINKFPEARLIYSDEDKVNDKNVRFDPYFKCDWNQDLFYSHNMIAHLGVYHTDLVKSIGGFREGLEGAQDYDLALRVIERIKPSQIHHIPRVLYHWRVHSMSTALNTDNKPYALEAGLKALNEHLARRGISALAQLTSHGYRVNYNLPEVLPLVSLIIPTRDGFKLIQTCIQSIFEKTTYQNYEIIIMDNGSADIATLNYFSSLKENHNVRVIVDARPFNYSALNNEAVKHAKGSIIGLINNDIEVISPNWLSEMVSVAIQANVGAVGAKLYYPDDSIQHAGVILGVGGVAGHSHKSLPRSSRGYFNRLILRQSLSAVTAACLIVKKSIYEEMNGLDENKFAVAFNDVDFCLRIKEAGYRNVWTPYAELYHHESATRGLEDTEEKKTRFSNEVLDMQVRWGDLLLNDPAYSPNLTFKHEDFSYAWPPRLTNVAANDATKDKKLSIRASKALRLIDRKGLGLEIGPSHNPLAPKREGYNVHILDHATAEELREKYKKHGVELLNIEEVDFVWHGEPLHELIGQKHCYDWILASHVIEHTPDLIAFLMECETLLKPEGVLSLIIPDKRYCFDYFNPVTSTGEVLDANYQQRKRPSPGKIFDHFAGAACVDGKIAWAAGIDKPKRLVHEFSLAKEHWRKSVSTTEYIDVHNWRFTPASFELLLSDLQRLDLTKLSILDKHATSGCEFYVCLGKLGLPVIDSRLDLIQTLELEL